MDTCILSQSPAVVKDGISTPRKILADLREKWNTTNVKATPFVLLPWREHILNGELAQWSNAAVAILPVLAAHENAMLEAFPSQNRIAHLAGISKSTVKAGINFLLNNGWLTIFMRKTKRAWQNVYRMHYQHYRRGMRAGRRFLALHFPLLMGQTWAAMSGAVRKLYLVLRAHCHDEGQWVQDTPASGAFLPSHAIDAHRFALLAGISDRMYRKGCVWLREHGLMIAERRGTEGWCFPVMTAQEEKTEPQSASENNEPVDNSATQSAADNEVSTSSSLADIKHEMLAVKTLLAKTKSSAIPQENDIDKNKDDRPLYPSVEQETPTNAQRENQGMFTTSSVAPRWWKYELIPSLEKLWHMSHFAQQALWFCADKYFAPQEIPHNNY